MKNKIIIILIITAILSMSYGVYNFTILNYKYKNVLQKDIESLKNINASIDKHISDSSNYIYYNLDHVKNGFIKVDKFFDKFSKEDIVLENKNISKKLKELKSIFERKDLLNYKFQKTNVILKNSTIYLSTLLSKSQNLFENSKYLNLVNKTISNIYLAKSSTDKDFLIDLNNNISIFKKYKFNSAEQEQFNTILIAHLDVYNTKYEKYSLYLNQLRDNTYTIKIDNFKDLIYKTMYKKLESINIYLWIYGFLLIFSTAIILYLIKRVELTNKNLKKTMKEQQNLLSLFEKGEGILFRCNNDRHRSADFISSNVKQLFGYTKNEFLSQRINYTNIIYKDDLNIVIKEVTDALEQNKDFFTHKPYRVITKDGTIKWVLNNTLLVKDTNGNVIHFLGYIADITELKKLELNLENQVKEKTAQNTKQLEVLQQQNKMASMGEMIGAIAHQWRQPLTEISTSIQNLKYDYEEGYLNDKKFIEEFINNSKKTIKFMSKTIDDFRTFFRTDKEKQDFNIKETTQAVITMQSAQLKEYDIILTISGEEFIYMGLKSEYQQVILNIINNAKDALISNNIQNPIIDILIDNKTISVTDNAGGISQDIINRIFEPYFTTKEQGKGTGMGLYMSKMIIEDNMGGNLDVKNLDNGAMFIVDLREKI